MAVSEDCSDSGNELGNCNAGILRTAFVATCSHNGNGHCWVEMSSRARAKGEDHTHQRCVNGEHWSFVSTKHIETDGQDEEVCAKELAEGLAMVTAGLK